MKLSNQAVGAIMMLLQKAILTQTDITDHLRDLNFNLDDKECLVVKNSPTFEIPKETVDEYHINEDINTVGSD